MEGWHLIVSDSNSLYIVMHEFFTFDELSKTFTVHYHQEKPGKYSLTVQIMSDCYFGLDLERVLKYEVGAVRKIV
jgi:hypothetical protein